MSEEYSDDYTVWSKRERTTSKPIQVAEPLQVNPVEKRSTGAIVAKNTAEAIAAMENFFNRNRGNM